VRLRGILKENSDGNKIIADNNSLLVFDKTSNHCNVYLKRSNRQERHWPYNLHILRLLLRMVINSSNNGALLHASSLEYNGDGYIFIGRGGSGKSTVARLLEPQRILSDDVTVIRKNINRYELFANPWWNYDKDIKIELPQKPATLKAVFFINKANKTSFKRLSYKKALREMMYGDAIFQQAGFFDNKSGIRSFYLFSLNLIKDIPMFELSVKKDRFFHDRFQEFISSYFQEGQRNHQ